MLRVEINLKIDNDNYKEEVVKLLKIKSSDIKLLVLIKSQWMLEGVMLFIITIVLI